MTLNNDNNKILEDIVKDAFAEQKKSRRWGVIFKSLTFVYLFVILILFYSGSNGKSVKATEPHVALVKVHGVIADDEPAGANKVVGGLRRAFENEQAKAVILAINSPGGSPVQAGYIYDEIQRLQAQQPEKKVYAVIADIGASGGYYIAAAADEIYADKASLVGSIGVTSSGFGFVESMEKLGIQRRHMTAGEHKAFLDPFSPLKEDEKIFWSKVLSKTHQQFIDVVKNGRGDRLLAADGGEVEKALFSGLIWNGEQALAMGLIDGLGSAGYVAREIIKEENIRDYTVQPSPLELLTRQLGVSVGEGIAAAVGLENQDLLQLK